MSTANPNTAPTKSMSVNLLAEHVSLDAPHYKASRFYNFPKELSELFPTPVSHADDHERHLSALSPAAYLVDLMQCIPGWQQFNEGLPDNANVSTMVTPDGKTLFAGTDSSGAYRRNIADGLGAKWQAFNENLPETSIRTLVLAPDGQTLFAGTQGNGVYLRKIADGAGGQWHEFNEGYNRSVWALAVAPDGSTLFASSQSGVYRRQISDGPGVQWQAFNEGLPDRLAVETLLVTPDGEALFAVSQVRGVFRRAIADTDAQWEDFNQNLTWVGQPYRFGGGPPRYTRIRALAVTPDGQTLFAGTEGMGTDGIGVYRRRIADGPGAHWQEFNAGWNDESVWTLAVTSDGQTLVAGTSDGNGVYRCDVAEGQWQEFSEHLPDSFPLTIAGTPDGQTLFFANQDGVFCRATNNMTLGSRRPDLWDRPLDREHTDELVPFLEIVNNVLRRHLGGRRTALERLAVSHFPFDMPVNLPLMEIRAYLAHFGLRLTDIYKIFRLGDHHDA